MLSEIGVVVIRQCERDQDSAKLLFVDPDWIVPSTFLVSTTITTSYTDTGAAEGNFSASLSGSVTRIWTRKKYYRAAVNPADGFEPLPMNSKTFWLRQPGCCCHCPFKIILSPDSGYTQSSLGFIDLDDTNAFTGTHTLNGDPAEAVSASAFTSVLIDAFDVATAAGARRSCKSPSGELARVAVPELAQITIAVTGNSIWEQFVGPYNAQNRLEALTSDWSKSVTGATLVGAATGSNLWPPGMDIVAEFEPCAGLDMSAEQTWNGTMTEDGITTTLAATLEVSVKLN